MNKSEILKLATMIVEQAAKITDGVVELIDARLDQRLRALAGSFSAPAQTFTKLRVVLGPPDAEGNRPVLRNLGPVKPRRNHTIQLCPAPRCKERAAPVFGMVCGKHKDASKKTVEAWRAARRARKARAS